MTFETARKHLVQEYQKLEDLVRETRLKHAHEGAQNVAIGCMVMMTAVPCSSFPLVAWPLTILGGIIGASNVNQLANFIDYKVRPEALHPDISIEITDNSFSLKSESYTFLHADLAQYQANPKKYLLEELTDLQGCVEYFSQTAQHIDNMKAMAVNMEAKLKDHPTVRKTFLAPAYWIRGTTLRTSLQRRLEAAQDMNYRLGIVEAVFECGKEFYQNLNLEDSKLKELTQQCYQLCIRGVQIVRIQKIVEQEVLNSLQKGFNYVYPHPEVSRWLPF